MKTYLKLNWHHNFDDEPTWLYSELDESRYETRKVEVFRNGRRIFADSQLSTGNAMLGEIPAPSLEELNAEAEFTASEIERGEFEAEWSIAHTGFS
ncbi:DUF6881 domain-containing protein [Streptomyces sp. NPDC099050]|uniref:DUF6881 domain-containing protein n=1 Tax=Streptomyces sp. NPDC099050 TaxID=3366100 RepID=UPI00381F530A